MKIANVSCNGIAVVTSEGEVLATITDTEITKQDQVNVFIDAYGFTPEEKWLVKENDLLYYTERPHQLYLCLACNNRFFHMSPVKQEGGNLKVSKSISLTYPNVSILGTLADYGLSKVNDGETETSNEAL